MEPKTLIFGRKDDYPQLKFDYKKADFLAEDSHNFDSVIDNSYDLIYGINVPSTVQFNSDLRRVLKPNGVYVVVGTFGCLGLDKSYGILKGFRFIGYSSDYTPPAAKYQKMEISKYSLKIDLVRTFFSKLSTLMKCDGLDSAVTIMEYAVRYHINRSDRKPLTLDYWSDLHLNVWGLHRPCKELLKTDGLSSNHRNTYKQLVKIIEKVDMGTWLRKT